MEQKHLSELADLYAAHIGRGLHTIAARVGVHNRFFLRLKDGRGCHIDTFDQVTRWFVANWPADLEWPRDIPRPAKRKEAA